MPQNVNARPGGRTEAGDTQIGWRSEASISGVADIECYRRRRACRRAELHLRACGLWGPASARVLDDLAGEVSA